jgi:hypothetical protein
LLPVGLETRISILFILRHDRLSFITGTNRLLNDVCICTVLGQDCVNLRSSDEWWRERNDLSAGAEPFSEIAPIRVTWARRHQIANYFIYWTDNARDS